MALSEAGHIIRISGKDKKKPKEFISLNILPAVCALLNSDGGTIETADIKLDVRSIEQIIKNMIGGTALFTSISVKQAESAQADHKILINVKKGEKFTTVNYNLFLPTQKQIIAIETTDSMEKIGGVLLHRGIVEDPVMEGSHLNNFVLDGPSGLDESDVVQLKNVKAEASNKANTKTFVKRMLSDKNKFSNYISGFANHRGGHIYYGIDDKGVVIGEKLTTKDTQEVSNEVPKAVEKLIWTERRILPKCGVNWKIYFEHVKDTEGEIVDSTYVVVVYVASFRGGVFTAEPESYYLKQGKVEKMDYSLWWKSFKSGAFSRYYFIKPSNMDSVTWSSDKNKKLFIQLSEKLVDHRDAGDFDSFDKLCKLAEKHFKENNAELVVKAGRVTIAYKSGDAELAKTLLQEFEDLLSSSKDELIFEVRLRLSQCLVARSVEDYKGSYEKSKEGLQIGQNIPPGLCLLWLYLECAMNAVCLAFQNQHEVKMFSEMKKEALVYLEEAARVANTLIEDKIPYRITDFQHKLCIYKVWALINYSVTGEAAEIEPSKEDLMAASVELSTVYKNKLNGKPLTKFREIEYYLAKCDYFTRSSEIMDDKMERKRKLQDAIHVVSKAKTEAEKKFKKLFEYAERRNEALEERVKLCKDDPSTSRTFEGFRY